jgi:hypothetical protein
MYHRDAGRGFQAQSDTNFAFGESSYGHSPFGSESAAYRQFDRREEPPQKRQRRNPSFPEVDTRYVLGSHKGASQCNGEDPTTPHSAGASFGDGYFSQYTAPNRSNDSPSRSYSGQSRTQYSYGDSNHYPTPDSSRSYQGHVSNRLSMGSELAMGLGGTTDPHRHHYPSSAETQASIPAPSAMHPPVLGTNRPSPTSDSRYWQGSLENSTTYTGYHGRGSSSSAIPTGHLLPAPLNLQSRSSMENTMQSL